MTTILKPKECFLLMIHLIKGLLLQGNEVEISRRNINKLFFKLKGKVGTFFNPPNYPPFESTSHLKK